MMGWMPEGFRSKPTSLAAVSLPNTVCRTRCPSKQLVTYSHRRNEQQEVQFCRGNEVVVK